jgi:hypothetical protein
LDQSELKKDFFQFIKYLEEFFVVHDRHGRAAAKNGGGGSNTDDKISAKGSGRGLGGKPGGSCSTMDFNPFLVLLCHFPTPRASALER